MNIKLLAKFLFSGMLAAGVNFGSRFIFSMFLDFSLAVVFAYLMGMFTAFWLFRTKVFKDGKTNIRQATFRFIVVNLLGVLQIWLISIWLLPALGPAPINEVIVHLVGISVTTIVSYFGHRFYTFRT